MRYLILSLDGGGVRVSLQWLLLKRLLDEFPDLLKNVTVFAGTSAGSILASALACGFSREEIDAILVPANMQRIFQQPWWHKIASLGGLVKAKYLNRDLACMLREHFDHLRIRDVPRALFIPAFSANAVTPPPVDIIAAGEEQQQVLAANFEHLGQSTVAGPIRRCDRWHAVFFHNLIDEAQGRAHGAPCAAIQVAEAILRSTAAPTYFPLAGNCVDGGVVHNNPSMAIMSHLLALGTSADEIYILSLGTGELPRQLGRPRNASLGLAQWISPLISMIMDANQEAISQTCHQVLGAKNFHRLEPLLTEEIALDSLAHYDEMMAIAANYDLSKTLAWIRAAIYDD
jgi:patatin-like phospholipase/acyl hydrolase